MFKNCRNSKKQGDLGLGLAIAYFVQNGYTVNLPLTDSQPYDLIVDKDDILQRVQVKTTATKRDKFYQVNLRTMGGNQKGYWAKAFEKKIIDLLFVVTESGKQYLIPTSSFEAVSSIVLYSPLDKYIINGRVGELAESA